MSLLGSHNNKMSKREYKNGSDRKINVGLFLLVRESPTHCRQIVKLFITVKQEIRNMFCFGIYLYFPPTGSSVSHELAGLHQFGNDHDTAEAMKKERKD